MMLKRAKIGKTCKLCTTDEFDSIVEVCHIKAIASFYPDTELEIINHITNLVYLCPNHHKMFDRGLIKLTSMV